MTFIHALCATIHNSIKTQMQYRAQLVLGLESQFLLGTVPQEVTIQTSIHSRCKQMVVCLETMADNQTLGLKAALLCGKQIWHTV